MNSLYDIPDALLPALKQALADAGHPTDRPDLIRRAWLVHIDFYDGDSRVSYWHDVLCARLSGEVFRTIGQRYGKSSAAPRATYVNILAHIRQATEWLIWQEQHPQE